MDDWYLENLVCPRTGESLRQAGKFLVSDSGNRYPVVNGIPVMLLSDVVQTQWVSDASLELAAQFAEGDSAQIDPYFIESLGIDETQRNNLHNFISKGKFSVDPVVSFVIGATNGIAYKDLVGRALHEYPIPELRLPDSQGDVLIDIGCSWGRWCVAAAKRGYRAVGIDPSIGAVLAAKRIAAELGLDIKYVIADARYLPFRETSVDVAFSYSVIQHFSREDAARAVAEIGRTLKSGGKSLVQMPTKYGMRCLYHQARRLFRDPKNFEVRYWSLRQLRNLFETRVGSATFSADCYFGIGLQASDIKFVSPLPRAVIALSERVRALSQTFGKLVYAADSVYVHSVKR